MSMASSSDNTPMYSPISSTTGSVLDGPPGDDASFSTTISMYNGPKTVLATFWYRFTTFLSNGTQARKFTLDEHPVSWPNILRLSDDNWSGSIRQSIDAIAREGNGAAKLLLVIFWSYILKDEEQVINSYFWKITREYAVTTLFNFQNAPEEYLGWVKT
jgi:hypothetical protein